MTAEELTLEILGERAFSQFDSQKLVDWAVNVMTLGYEGLVSLRMNGENGIVNDAKSWSLLP